MRLKGSKDKKKRKVKVILCGNKERDLINDYTAGWPIKKLCDKYKVARTYISSLFTRRKIPKRVEHSTIQKWELFEDITRLEDDICGIYAIYFLWNYNNNDIEKYSKINNIKLYIGSSINIKQRLLEHYRLLNNKIADNQSMQNYFDNKEYSIKFAIVERCSDKEVMQKERAYQNKFNRSCLLNSWVSTNGDELLPWLKQAVKLKSYQNYSVNTNGCWECKTVHKSGYSRIAVVAFKDWGPGIKKYFYSHRVAYWEKYGEYAELIRHKCGNSKCRNPDHLIKGNYRDNAIDKRGDFPETFEKKWIEFGGNVIKLTQHFGWKPNCRIKDSRIVSSCVYDWEKKLNLRNKYPEILEANRDRKKTIINTKGL